jgi:hypothetical protein
MTNTTIITLNAVLDLAVVLAVFTLVRLTHGLDREKQRIQTIPVALERVTEDLSRAA